MNLEECYVHIDKLEAEIKTLREIAKSKTPAVLTESQAERMPPDIWYSKESYEKLVTQNSKLEARILKLEKKKRTWWDFTRMK